MDVCLNCGGAIGEVGKAYGYAGKWCQCPVNPAIFFQRPASKERQAKLEPIYDAVYEIGVSFLNAQDKTGITELELLLNENHILKQEIEILRQYGNKDCLAMADDVLSKIRGKNGTD